MKKTFNKVFGGGKAKDKAKKEGDIVNTDVSTSPTNNEPDVIPVGTDEKTNIDTSPDVNVPKDSGNV